MGVELWKYGFGGICDVFLYGIFCSRGLGFFRCFFLGFVYSRLIVFYSGVVSLLWLGWGSVFVFLLGRRLGLS